MLNFNLAMTLQSGYNIVGGVNSILKGLGWTMWTVAYNNYWKLKYFCNLETIYNFQSLLTEGQSEVGWLY